MSSIAWSNSVGSVFIPLCFNSFETVFLYFDSKSPYLSRTLLMLVKLNEISVLELRLSTIVCQTVLIWCEPFWWSKGRSASISRKWWWDVFYKRNFDLRIYSCHLLFVLLIFAISESRSKKNILNLLICNHFSLTYSSLYGKTVQKAL